MAEDTRFTELMAFFGGKVDISEDSEGINFKEPIRGKYICRIVELILNTEPWPSGDPRNQWDLRMQVVEDVDGDKSGNRYLNKKYDLSGGSKEFPKDAAVERGKLFSALATAGVKFTINKDESKDPDVILATIATQITDQLVNVSAWPMTTGEGKIIQVCKIVKEFKVVKNKEAKPEALSGGWKK